MSDPWCLSFAFESIQIRMPLKILYDDYLCRKRKKRLDISGWRLNQSLFSHMGTEFRNIRSIVAVESSGLNFERLEYIRGLSSLTSVNFRKSIVFDIPTSRIIASWTNLNELDISECRIEPKSFQTLTLACSELKKLSCVGCTGLDDLVLVDVADLIQRYRNLSYINLSNNSSITDEGVLMVAVTGSNILKSLDISHCKNVATLSIAGLRKRMIALEYLSISNLNVSVSAFEWIPEGCAYLKILDISRCIELDDVTLTLIGKKCKLLENVNISKCLKITDIGITGFVSNFEGKLKKLDLSGCVLLGIQAAYELSKICSDLCELKLNGLSHMDGTSLKSLWSSCGKGLVKFEMCAELKGTSNHRRSTIPHISDMIFTSTKYSNIREIRLSGACLVTDVGAGAVAKRCKSLVSLDVGYCNGISNKLLVILAQSSPQLQELIVSGCNKVSDIGLQALFQGCKLISRFESAGCVKVTDIGVKCVPKCITNLNIRNCDHVTDQALYYLAAHCKNLTSLDVTSLDMVSAEGIARVARNCLKLTYFNCSSCNMTSHEFSAVTRSTLPLATAAAMKCCLQSRPRDIFTYNSYVLKVREDAFYITIIQRFARVLISRRFRRRLRATYERSSVDIQRCFRGYMARKLFRELKRLHAIENRNATRLQRLMRRMFGQRYVEERKHRENKRLASSILIQRIFRGYASRKRSRKLKLKRMENDRKLAALVKKALVISYTRKLIARVILLQRCVRKLLALLRYKRTYQKIIIIQSVIRCVLAMKRKVIQIREKKAAHSFKVHRAVQIIERFYLNKMYNYRIRVFVTVCALYYSSKYESEAWYATKIQAHFRGYICRKHLNGEKRSAERRENAAVAIQRIYRGYVIREWFYLFRGRLRRIFRNWRKLQRGVLRLDYGKYAEKIQRAYRLHLFRVRRERAARVIQKAYRRHFEVLQRQYEIAQWYDYYAARIQRMFRSYLWRRWRQEETAKRHIMARRIQVTYIYCS